MSEYDDNVLVRLREIFPTIPKFVRKLTLRMEAGEMTTLEYELYPGMEAKTEESNGN